MSTFEISAYLDRLGLADIPPTAEGLARLQSAQIRAIPFENIGPLLGQVPDLDPAEIARKCLSRRRGGYCFELNLLFLAALRALDFDAAPRLARVRMGAAAGGPRSHLLTLCRVGGADYIADAGFGGPGPLEPVRRDAQAGQDVANGTYVTGTDATTGETVLSRRDETGDFALYGFDDAWVGQPDIDAANHLCATWPKMPFPSHLMAGGYDGDTRIGLFDTTMTETRGEARETRELENAGALHDVLCRRLGLALTREDTRAVWARIAPS